MTTMRREVPAVIYKQAVAMAERARRGSREKLFAVSIAADVPPMAGDE
jgi:hypothetical protein